MDTTVAMANVPAVYIPAIDWDAPTSKPRIHKTNIY